MGERPPARRLDRDARAAGLSAPHRPKKRFGQHFLADASVVDRIVREIAPAAGDRLVEIGPGAGALTLPLLATGVPLTVIELDRDLAARWRGDRRVTTIEGDVLDVDVRALAAGGPLRIVGNLPYNVSTPILFHLLAAADRIVDQHVMLQKEVVERMAASPGGRTYGRLSVMLQWRYAIEPLFDVAPEAFRPPPQVESTVVRMVPLAEPPPVDTARLAELVTLAFSQRRKLLRHTLGRVLRDTAFDLQRRAEEVPVAEYVALAQRA